MPGNAVIGALRVNLGLDTAEFQNGVKAVQGSLSGIGKMFSVLGGAAVFAGFTVGIKDAVGRIEDMRKLSAQLDQALANTGNTAKTSSKEIEAFADDLERSTGRAAEEVMAVSTNLATYGFGREAFFEAIKLADDMSAAWGGDLKQNMEGLARALADPEKGLAMLTKRGITFTDEQKNMIAGFIKANDLAGAQGVIFDALNEQVQGVAAAGFGGLTKASANVTKALEDMFEGIANGIGLNSGLEMSLGAVAVAIDFVSANLGVFAKAAGVAGTALVTAMGPAIWASLSAAATTYGTAAVTAIRAVGTAILLNPIGAIVVALAAAVSAAFLFRDEIKQAIGIDFVGIVGDAVNATIGGFVGAFNAIKATWSLLPAALGDVVIKTANVIVQGIVSAINKGSDLLNGFIGRYNEGLIKMGQKPLPTAGTINFGGFANPFAGAADSVGAAITDAFEGAQGDYLGKLAGMFEGIGGAADAAGANVKGFGDLLDATMSGGGAGVDGLKGKVDGLGGAFAGVNSAFSDTADILKSGLSSMAVDIAKAFRGAGDAGQAALDAIGAAADNLFNKLIAKASDSALDWLFNSIGGLFGGGMLGNDIGGGISGMFGSGGLKFPGLATGGRTMSAGLVEVGERGRELVNLPAGAQVIRNSDIGDFGGGGTSRLEVNLSPELIARVLSEAAGQTVQIVQANDRANSEYRLNGGN